MTDPNETAAVREHHAEQEQTATDHAAALAAPIEAKMREHQARDRAEHRAAVLREAADFVRGLLLTRTSITVAELEAELRRRADEAQQPGIPRCPSCGHTICNGDGPCGALLDAWQRCPCSSPGAVEAQQQPDTETRELQPQGRTDPTTEAWRTDPRERLLAAIDSTWAYTTLGSTPEALADAYQDAVLAAAGRIAPAAPTQADDEAVVKLVAAALREHYLCTNRDEADADGNMPCRCGDWREPGPMGSDEDDWDTHLAEVALAVLPPPADRGPEQLGAAEAELRPALNVPPLPAEALTADEVFVNRAALRAAVLREAIDIAREEGHRLEEVAGIEPARGARSVAYLLRKLLAKAQPTAASDGTLSPSEEHAAALASVLTEIRAERTRQDAKWGEQNHPDGTGADEYQDAAASWRKSCQRAAATGRPLWAPILLEEVYEALAEADPARLRAELVQVAAVAVAWAEAIDRRT